MYFDLFASIFALAANPLELRIDVSLPPDEVERELEMLNERLNSPDDALHELPRLCIHYPGLIFRYREADGEHYIYVQDMQRACLAGYTVLNRLIELTRRADPVLRAPHSKYAAAYQRRGIATAIYRWWLDSGNCLISGARQSAGAHSLWKSLNQQYGMIYVDLRNKTLRCLGRRVSDEVQSDLHTRLVMLGKGWTVEGLKAATGMQGEIGDDRIGRLPGSGAQDAHQDDRKLA